MRAIGKISLGMGLVVCLAFSVLTSSCRKDKPTIVVVTVIDSVGKTVPGAVVNMVGNGTTPGVVVQPSDKRFNDTKTTNGLGKVSFDYSDLTKPGQSGFVVLDVDATKGNAMGQTVVEVEEHTTTEATVRIRE